MCIRDRYDYVNGQVGGWRVGAVFVVVTGAFFVLHSPALLALWHRRRAAGGIDPVAWIWVGASVAALVPGFRFVVHYFQILVPPVALVVGLTWSELTSRVQRTVLAASALIAIGCAGVAVLPVANASQVSPALASAVEANTTANDRVMVWGALPELYWRTRHLPGVRFLSVGYVNGNWADQPSPPADTETTAPYRSRWSIFNADLLAHPPTLVVDMSASKLGGWSRYPAANYSFGALLHDCYRPVAIVDGDVLWRLTSRECVTAHTD